jgi:NAD(P)-dependent dehydrogenase (short-subunit alcohol dehydrogenase family)
MKIVVIDGKGGGIGSQIVERLKALKNSDLEIIVLGTNSQATINMLRAGANDGATGENAIVWMSKKADIIVGPMAIIAANSMMGEISPKMAEAVASSDAKKLLLPISKCNFEIVGLENYQLKQLFDGLIERIKEYIDIK